MPRSKTATDKELRAGLTSAGSTLRASEAIFFRGNPYKGIALRSGKVTFQTPEYFERWTRLNFEITNNNIPENDLLRTVFEIAGMDHENPSHWRKLLLVFAQFHFGRVKSKPKRSALEFAVIKRDYDKVKQKNPAFKEKQVCEHLIRHKRSVYGNYKAEALRKILRQARSKARNPTVRYADTPEMVASFARSIMEKRGVPWTTDTAAYAEDISSWFLSFMRDGKIPSHS